MPFADWIRVVIADRQGRTGPPQAAILAGLAESISAGITTIGEIATAPVLEYSHRGPQLTLFREVIGFSRARAASTFAEAVKWLGPSRSVPPAQGADFACGLSPHSPYTVSPALLRLLVAAARERNLPVAMHLAESADELELLHSGGGPLRDLLDERSMWDAGAIPRGSRSIDYLRALAIAPRAIIIHGNYLDAEERSYLASHADHMSLVYCPRTHAYFRHPPYPLLELMRAGVRVALGTDSRASNPDLNLLADMSLVARAYPEVDPQQVLRMGTLAGAESLGRGHEIGSLSTGKLADLVALPLPVGAPSAANEMLSALMSAPNRPSAVWRRGQECAPHVAG
jgi:cytosine/adenosine deaminase-related metal-dependent hydrolase